MAVYGDVGIRHDVFFFKQKTGYDVRISDWSSDVCSADLTCVSVDHGLMRLGEAEQVVSLFREHYGIKLVHVNAEERFLGGLAGLTDPGKKRSSESRVGTESVSTCRSRWSPLHSKQKQHSVMTPTREDTCSKIQTS